MPEDLFLLCNMQCLSPLYLLKEIMQFRFQIKGDTEEEEELETKTEI